MIELSVQPLPKIGPFKDQLDGILASNETKAAREQAPCPGFLRWAATLFGGFSTATRSVTVKFDTLAAAEISDLLRRVKNRRAICCGF